MRSHTRSRTGVRGYILLGIAIGLVIMGIFMAAAVPLWKHAIQRDKEEELLWRGRQYVQAIERYQRKYPGAFPSKMEDLVKQKFLRKPYEDPMSEDGEWRILRQNSPEVRGLTGAGGRQRQRGGGQARRTPRRQGSPSSGLGSRSMSGQALGGIIGVASKSEDKTIRIPGKKQQRFMRTVGKGEQYNEWLFVSLQARNPAQRKQPGAGSANPQRPPSSRQP